MPVLFIDTNLQAVTTYIRVLTPTYLLRVLTPTYLRVTQIR